MNVCQKLLAIFLITTILLLAAVPAFATEETTDPYEGELLGNLGGVRSALADKGVDVTVDYKGDMWSAENGGRKHGEAYLDNLDMRLGVDNEKLLGLTGNKALVYFINNEGGKPNSYPRSVQGVDNIEVKHSAFQLSEAWDEQTFLDNKVAVLLGLHDLNAEFDETDMTSNFIMPTMQLDQTLAQAGGNGPATFPDTALAGRVKLMPTEHSYLSVAAFNGVVGNLNHAYENQFNVGSKNGFLLVSEAGITPHAPVTADTVIDKFGIGAWTYTNGRNDFARVNVNGSPVRDQQAGAYALSSYQFYTDEQAARDLGAYLRAGAADGEVDQVNWGYEAGFVGHGWIPTREKGEMGLGLSQSHNGGPYVQAAGDGARRNEYSIEWYYRDQIVSGLAVQPDVQYIINPAATPGVNNATVVGLRFDVNF